MDESGCFFKALPDEGLVQKGKQSKGSKKSKQRFTIAFFVSDAGQKLDEPIFIWKSKLPRCFKGLRDPSRPGNVHYFSNSKSWMTSEIFETVLSKLNRKLVFENRKVIYSSTMLHVIQNQWMTSFLISKLCSFLKILHLDLAIRCWYYPKL